MLQIKKYINIYDIYLSDDIYNMIDIYLVYTVYIE